MVGVVAVAIVDACGLQMKPLDGAHIPRVGRIYTKKIDSRQGMVWKAMGLGQRLVSTHEVSLNRWQVAETFWRLLPLLAETCIAFDHGR